jgi:NAD(P)-dependent dehydrogenase (short-subunit alcohol dehydrogenase family)
VPTALIVGASRGLGLALAAEFVTRGWHVIGTVRGDKRTELHDLADEHPGKVEVETLDMTAPDQIAALRERLAERTLDLLFLNAGIATEEPFARIEAVGPEEFSRVMLANAYAPLRVIAALQDRVPTDGLIGAMSSGQGSIATNTSGNNDAYRASKAALNMLMRSFAAREGEKRPYALIAPGWIRTELGGPNAPYTVEDTVPLVVDVLLAKRARPGLEFLDRFGKTVPW